MAEPDDTTTEDQPTKTALLERARELDIPGRSTMDADELAAAVAAVEFDVSSGDQVIAGKPIVHTFGNTKGQTAASLQAAIDNANLSTTALDESLIEQHSPPPV
jgi:hypothetical protein